MKNIYIILLFVFTCSSGFAQPLNGSVAPDFTFTDINGVSRHLYSYLDSGKYVALDISATWCHPCWDYHETGTPDSIYNLHDVPGDNTWRVFFIEGDGATNSADLNGTGTATQGDWVTGSLYPIIDPPTGIGLNDFLAAYNINFFPTLLIICPNRLIYQDMLNTGAKPTAATWEYAAGKCATLGVQNTQKAEGLSAFPNPATDDLTLQFSLDNESETRLTVTNMVGQIADDKKIGALPAGKQSLHYKTGHLKPGQYLFTISAGNYTERIRVAIK